MLDTANNYYVTWRSSNVIQLKRKVNGAFVTLAEKRAAPRAQHAASRAAFDRRLAPDGRRRGNQVLAANDTTFSHGRAALLTYRARADFDNVFASPTAPLNVNFNDWVFYWYGFGRPFTELGGNWEITGQQDPEGMSQTTTTGLALAYNGVAIDNQVIRANMRLDSFARSSSGAWFGLLARYVDEQNHYFLSVRSSNQLQIRKIVNGVTTVLEAVAFTAAPGSCTSTPSVSSERTACVRGWPTRRDGSRRSLPRGKYGMGTYRAAATWQDFSVEQP